MGITQSPAFILFFRIHNSFDYLKIYIFLKNDQSNNFMKTEENVLTAWKTQLVTCYWKPEKRRFSHAPFIRNNLYCRTDGQTNLQGQIETPTKIPARGKYCKNLGI